MGTVRSISIVFALLAASTPSNAEPILLGSFDAIAMGAGAPETEFRIQIVLRNDLFPDYDPIDIGHGIFWEDGDSGVIEFSNSDENFEEMAARVTDGVDQFLSTIVFATLGGAGDGAVESQLFGLPVDLIGNELEFIRLLVHSVTIEFYDSPYSELEGIQWNVDMTWEFWGEPIPEPQTIAIMVLGCYSLLKRKPLRIVNCADTESR